MSEQAYAYVGIKACGCCVAAAVIKPEFAKDNAKFCARLINKGLTVERKPVEWLVENLKRCRHQP